MIKKKVLRGFMISLLTMRDLGCCLGLKVRPHNALATEELTHQFSHETKLLNEE